VIAIESEREFGLSVMEQLDRELKRRGDLFRELSVQNVGGFRQTGHPDPMPRILLIIDEFQEIFVEDDKIAQDASLILDRLVRQGRAFGIHVLLGSQTLGGSYSLPRATMGQMAIRIALMSHHYRQDHMWQEGDLTEAQVLLADLQIALSRMEVAATDEVIVEIISALSQDIDTPRALAALRKWIVETSAGGTGGKAGELSRAIDALLGIAI
jgi:hypothetical protein